MLRGALKTVVLTSLAVAACGCAMPSAQATPFFGEGKASTDRVNLWPVFYHDGPATSFLWPVGEHITDKRFLISPFYSQEELGEGKRRYGALGPLVAFNQKTGENRIFPVFWKAGGYFVLFPLIWLYGQDGLGSECSAVFPLWMQFREKEGISTHLFWPFVHWRTPPKGGRPDPEEEYGWRLWPAYGHYSQGKRNTHYWLWPFGRYQRHGDDRLGYFLPFYFGWEDAEGRLDIVPPVYMRQRTGDVNRLAVLPLFFSQWAAEASKLWVFPTYWRSVGKAARTDALFPFFYLFRDEDSHRLGIFPFVYRGREGDELYQWVFPTYFSKTGPDSTTRMFLPFYYGHKSPQKTALGLLPFYYGSYGKGWSHTNVAGILWDSRIDGDSHEWWALMPFSGGAAGRGARRHHVWPAYSYQQDGDDRRVDLVPLLPIVEDGPQNAFLSLVGWRRKPDYRSFWVVPYWTTRQEGSAKWRALGEAWQARTVERTTHVLPLYRHRYRGPEDGSLVKLEAVPNPEDAVNRYPTAEVADRLFPLWNSVEERVLVGPQQGVKHGELDLLLWLYNYDRRVYAPNQELPDERLDTTHWQVLWELVDYKREQMLRPSPAGSDDSSRLRVLWRVVYYERRGDDVSFDALPGITYDSRPGEKKVFSFLWRVLRYEWDHEEGTKWHVLFVPFGG